MLSLDPENARLAPSEVDKVVDARRKRLLTVLEDVARRRDGGEMLSDTDVVSSHQDLLPELVNCLSALSRVASAQATAKDSLPGNTKPDDTQTSPRLYPQIRGYRFMAEIHRGGQGTVYRAMQESTSREVAIKVMHHGITLEADQAERFRREVRTLAQVDHPNVVTIHDSGIADGNYYVVMDYVRGQSLDEYVQSQRPSLREFLRIFANVCEGVGAAHVRGIIHRDLKPSNIVVECVTDRSGENQSTEKRPEQAQETSRRSASPVLNVIPRVLDFGLAKLSQESLSQATTWRSMTMTGQFVGSLPWASPEQVDGFPKGVDLRTDVYSLGVMLYQLLTGAFPYSILGRPRDVFLRIAEHEPARPSDLRKEIDDEVETIILKCLSKDPDRRYESAHSLARDLRRYLTGQPIEAKRESTVYMLRKLLGRYRVAAAVVVLFVLVLAVSSIIAWTLYGRSQDRLRTAYLERARTLRRTEQPGRTRDGLDLIVKAASIRPGDELREEAIALLALPDVKVQQEWPCLPESESSKFHRGEFGIISDPAITQYHAFQTTSGHFGLFPMGGGSRLDDPPLAAFGGATPRYRRDGPQVALCWELHCEVRDDNLRDQLVNIDSVRTDGRSIDFRPERAEVAIGTVWGSIEIHDFVDCRKRTFEPFHAPLSWVRYDHSGSLIATVATGSRDVYIRNADNGAIVQIIEHATEAKAVAWNPKGNLVATSCFDYNVYLWDVRGGDLVNVLSGHRNVPTILDIDASGRTLISYSWDGQTIFWDILTGTRLAALPVTVKGEFPLNGTSFAFSRNTRQPTCGIAELVRSTCLDVAYGAIGNNKLKECLAIDEYRGLGAHPEDEYGVIVWDLKSGERIARLPERMPMSLHFRSESDELIASGPAGVSVFPFWREDSQWRFGSRQLLRRNNSTRSAMTSDERLLLVAEGGRHVAVLTLDNPNEPIAYLPHEAVNVVAVAPDNRLCATSAWRNRGVRIWDLTTFQLVRELPIQAGTFVAFSPDGKYLATYEEDFLLWDTKSWNLAHRIPRSAGATTRHSMGTPMVIAFSPDGNLIALTDSDSRITLLDGRNYRSLGVLEYPMAGESPVLVFGTNSTDLYFIPENANAVYVWKLSVLFKELESRGLN